MAKLGPLKREIDAPMVPYPQPLEPLPNIAPVETQPAKPEPKVEPAEPIPA